MSRLASAFATQFVALDRPFSNFDFAEAHFEGSFPIRRLFSQARSRGCRTLVYEQVPAEGAVADENREIATLFEDHRMTHMVRLSFWRPSYRNASEFSKATSSICLG